MKSTLAVAWKELLQTSRDPLSLAMLLGVPAMMLLLYGFALNFDVRHVRLAVVDRDGSAASRDLVASFVSSSTFDLAADLPAGADLERVTERRLAQAILVVPEGYGADLSRGKVAQVQLVVDGSDARTATTILGYAKSLVASKNADRVASRLEELGLERREPIRYSPRVWYNPELESTQFLVPGLIGFILMLTAVISTAMSVVREKERGTLEQLRVTPLRPEQLLVGKVLPYLVISLAATALILIAARLLFEVEVRGPYLALFVATVVYLLGALGWGLLVSSFSSSQAMAYQIGIVTSLLPAIFLSGFIFPIRSMPTVLQWITYAVPARYFLVILRGVILKGAGLAPYARDLAFLGAFAFVVLAVATVRLVRESR